MTVGQGKRRSGTGRAGPEGGRGSFAKRVRHVIRIPPIDTGRLRPGAYGTAPGPPVRGGVVLSTGFAWRECRDCGRQDQHVSSETGRCVDCELTIAMRRYHRMLFLNELRSWKSVARRY